MDKIFLWVDVKFHVWNLKLECRKSQASLVTKQCDRLACCNVRKKGVQPHSMFCFYEGPSPFSSHCHWTLFLRCHSWFAPCPPPPRVGLQTANMTHKREETICAISWAAVDCVHSCSTCTCTSVDSGVNFMTKPRFYFGNANTDHSAGSPTSRSGVYRAAHLLVCT